jgi:elongation factor P
VATATEIRKGQVLIIDKELWVVLDYKHITPGNWRGYVQVVMRHLASGRKDNVRMRSTDKVEIAFIDTKELQYLFKDNLGLHFMDTETYEQIALDRELVEYAMDYLREGDTVKVTFYESTPIGVELPTSVVLEVAEADPGLKGDSVSNVFKPAVLETGLTIKVPNFVNAGEKVKVDTRTGEFMERA